MLEFWKEREREKRMGLGESLAAGQNSYLEKLVVVEFLNQKINFFLITSQVDLEVLLLKVSRLLC